MGVIMCPSFACTASVYAKWKVIQALAVPCGITLLGYVSMSKHCMHTLHMPSMLTAH